VPSPTAVRRVAPDALLGPDSLSARLLGHPATLLGGPRALLLQLAHPLVSAAVRSHSSFERDPFSRLARTFEVMIDISFGPPEVARASAASLAAVHRQVKGTTKDGAAYAAQDPQLALWVHATLVDTLLLTEKRYIGELDEDGRGRLYDESRLVAPRLGIPGKLIPRDLGEFRSYFEEELRVLVGSGVNEDALSVASRVLHPPGAPAFGPLAGVESRLAERLIEAATVDLGPPELCSAFGLPPHNSLSATAVFLDLGGLVSRSVSRWVPGALLQPRNLARLTSWLAADDAENAENAANAD